MLLYLIRHASAKNSSVSGKDFDRCLTKEGIKQSKQLGVYLADSTFSFNEIYVSSSQRTRETAKYALDPKMDVKYDDSLYLPNSKQLLKFINKLETGSNLLIVGHNEGISNLASYLTNQYIGLNTANAVIIEFECINSNEISGETGRVIDVFSPI
jgi:phosphohistidine phosphatase